MKIAKLIGWMVVAALAAGVSAQAKPRKKELSNKETFTAQDAEKGQAYVTAAMTVPMLELLQKADVQHPEYMLQYGIGLDLGRPSESSRLSAGEKEKLKGGFRAMLDLYLNSRDKFDIEFDEDAMLDQSEFWIYLAKHVGRRKQQVDLNPTITLSDAGGGNAGAAFFMPDTSDQNDEFNLNQDLLLKPNVVNAATTCAQSAFGFARMKKAQLVDISETKLTPDQFATVQASAVRVYRLSYSTGVLACGSRDYFLRTAEFASQNLGKLGGMKENPAAVLASLSENTTEEKTAN